MIGLDNSDLHRTLREVASDVSSDPIARLTPLGWTCIGNTGLTTKFNPGSRFVNSFFQDTCLDQINQTIQKFWSINESLDNEPMSVIDQEILEKTKNDMKYLESEKKYLVKIPWKDKPNLPNNYDMALKRLYNTEKKLLKDNSLKNKYANILENYLQKGYICNVM